MTYRECKGCDHLDEQMSYPWCNLLCMWVDEIDEECNGEFYT